MRTAKGYEYLITKAFGCKRYDVAGADSGIFKEYQNKQILYEVNLLAIKNGKAISGNSTIEDLAYQAGVETGKVVAHITNAISYLKKKHKKSLSSHQCQQLDNFQITLLTPTHKSIGEVMEKLHYFFSETNLKMN